MINIRFIKMKEYCTIMCRLYVLSRELVGMVIRLGTGRTGLQFSPPPYRLQGPPNLLYNRYIYLYLFILLDIHLTLN